MARDVGKHTALSLLIVLQWTAKQTQQPQQQKCPLLKASSGAEGLKKIALQAKAVSVLNAIQCQTSCAEPRSMQRLRDRFANTGSVAERRHTGLPKSTTRQQDRFIVIGTATAKYVLRCTSLGFRMGQRMRATTHHLMTSTRCCRFCRSGNSSDPSGDWGGWSVTSTRQHCLDCIHNNGSNTRFGLFDL